jgi:lipopolysaccharide transport system permease protein
MQRKYIELIWLRGIGALKADAQNSYLGSVWWVLEPLLLTGLFYLAFASGLRGKGSGPEFALFLFCGLLPFKWTASCLNIGANSILSNKGIMAQTYLPKWIFPATINLSMAIRFMFSLAILLALVNYGGYTPSLAWWSLIYVVLFQLIFNLGLSYIFAATTPLLPDLSHLVPLFTTGLLFSSGVFFDINDRPEDMRAILSLNPFVEILDSYRAVLLRGETLSPLDLIYSGSAGIFALAVGYLILKLFDRFYPRALP